MKEEVASQIVSLKRLKKMSRKKLIEEVYEITIFGKEVETEVSSTDEVGDGSKELFLKNIDDLLKEYPAVFPKEAVLTGLPKERNELSQPAMAIDTGNAAPIKSSPYAMSPTLLKELKRQLKVLINAKLIRPSNSPWGAPVLFVKKKDGTFRLVIDYRRLNAVTKPDAYPMPKIQDNLDRLGKAKVFSVMDATAGFHQNRIKEEDVEKTAFVTRYGSFEFLVTPFGLKNSPSAFQRMMNEVLGDLLDTCCVCYIDDLVVYSDDEEQHLKHLRLLSDRLMQFGIQINLKKSRFGVSDFTYCGYRVMNGKTSVDPSKLSMITEWPTPTNVTDVRRFLGFANYYRRFIKNYAGMAAPLTDLTRAESKWCWTLLEQRAFNELKRALLSEPVLVAPDENKIFDIKVDAGPFAIGGVLEQDGHPIAYEYHRLSSAEEKYSQYEKEFLAALVCLRKWKHYIEGRQFRLHTDNSGLVQLLKTQKDPHHRIARWLDEFSLWSPDIIHVEGKVNVADAPSRLNIPYLKSDVPISDLDAERGLEVSAVWTSDVLHIEVDDENDWPLLCAHYLLSKRHPEGLPEDLKRKIEKETEKFTIIDDKLMRILPNKNKVHYLPKDSRIETMERFHQGLGHLKFGSVKELITRRYWWPSMENDMIEFIRNCPQCQLAASSNVVHSRPPVQPVPPVAIPFERWALDFVGPLERTAKGNRYILTAIDYATRWVVCAAVPEADHVTVKRFLYDLMVDYGSPSEVLTDRGKAFLAKGVQEFMSANKILKLNTAPYHPQTNGMVERMHAMLKSSLTALTNGQPLLWDLFLKQALFAIRVRRHAVTKYSPFYLMYGTQPRLPGDMRNPELPPVAASDEEILARNVQTMIELGYARGSAYHESQLQAERMRSGNTEDQRDYFFQVGDLVKRKNGNPRKFEFNWTGPYLIASVGHPGTYWLRKMNGEMLTAPINQMDLAPWLANTRDNVSFFYEPVVPQSDEDV